MKSNLPITAAMLFAGIAATASAASSAQTIVPAQSEIGFVSKQMGVPVEGKFKKWTAQIVLDPRKPEVGKVAFVIDTGSASFGAAETDAEVPKAAWFNVAKFPQASFTSTAIKSVGAGKFEVAGQLAIKGSTQNVVVPVNVAQSGANSIANGAFTLKRLDFKIGEGEWADTSMVANEVQVKFKLSINGLAPL